MREIASIHIGTTAFEVDYGLVRGQDLLDLAAVVPPQQLVFKVHGELDVPIDPNDYILLRGNELFAIGNGNPPLPDNPSHHPPIRIKIDGHEIPESAAFHHAKVTVADIKRLAPGVQPSDQLAADLRFVADEILQDQWRLILQPWYEFVLVPCGNVGDASPAEDHLRAVQKIYPGAQIERDAGGQRYLRIPDVPLPEGWARSTCEMLLLIPNGYPIASMDMFWVDPPLLLPGGTSPASTSIEVHLGRNWQRFSWHYVGNGWRPGESSMLSHLRFALSRLQQVS